MYKAEIFTAIVVAFIALSGAFMFDAVGAEPEQLGLSTLQVVQGGTGATTFSSGECLVGNGTGAVTTSACGGAGSGTIGTTTALVDTYVTYATGWNTIGNESTFTYDDSTDLLTVGSVALPLDNDPTNPTIAFGDGNTGFYEATDNSLAIATQGLRKFIVDTVSFKSDSSTGPYLLQSGSSATTPSLAPRSNDTNTGIGSGVADTLSLITGGTERINIGTGGITTIVNGFVSQASSTVNSTLTVTGAITGDLTGNADTATALSANGANCSSGQAPLGVDASGAVESCFDVWTEAENTAAGYSTVSALADLSDVNTVAYGAGRILIGDGLTGYDDQAVSGDISLTDAGVVAISGNVIVEADLNADEAPTNNDILTYDSTGANFSWQTPAELSLYSDADVSTYLTGGTGITESAGTISFDCSEVEGVGINCATEAITLDATGDWTGTLDSIDGSAFFTEAEYIASTTNPYITAMANLSITESQISDLGSYLTAETNSLETVATGILDDEIPVGTGADTVVYKSIPDCDTAASSKLLYDQATNAFSCGTDQNTGGNSASLEYAGISFEDTASPTTLEVGDNVWTQVTVFDTDASESSANGDHTTDDITIANTGDYFIAGTFSFDLDVGGANDVIEIHIEKNNGATDVGDCHVSRLVAGATQAGASALSCLVTLTANDTIELWAKNADSGADIDFYTAEISLIRVDVGGGDVSAVGDCASGECFTADGTGNTLYFEGSTADGIEHILTGVDPTATDKTFTFPNDQIASGDIIVGSGAGTFNYTAQSSVALSGYNDDLTHLATAITDGLIVEADLNADEAPADNDILTYDTTGANFSWQTPAELSLQPLDTELTLLAGLTETTGNVIISVGGAWASVAQPIIDCTNCTNIPSSSSHTGTLTWGGTAILESGIAFQFGDGTDATLTHTYANTGTNVDIAYSTGAMAVTGNLTATNLSGTNTGDNDEVGTKTTGDLCINDGSSVNCTVNTEAELETALDALDVLTVTADDVSSANLLTLISDETGTGVAVFGTAPTFTTNITVTGGGVIDAGGIDLDTGNAYEINNTSVLNATTLGTAVVNSSLTNVGTLTTVSVSGLTNLGAGSLEIPNGTAPTTDAVGELAFDTTDDQLIIDDGTTDYVIRTEETLYQFTLASTSIEFVSGGEVPLPPNKDGFALTKFKCYVVGGTSVVVNLSDGTNDTETITCATTLTSDEDVATNDTFTAGELGEVQIGTITGTPDYLMFTAYGTITRE